MEPNRPGLESGKKSVYKLGQVQVTDTGPRVEFGYKETRPELDLLLFLYLRIVGSLMYIMNCTRPDIAYSVSKLSGYTNNLGEDHWKALVRVLRYLKYTINYGLHYTRYPAVLEGYSDANWISDTKDSKSRSGYVFTFGGAIVSWKSSKQTCIVRSTTESKFIALDKAREEAELLHHFLEDMPMWTNPVPSICIHCDSKLAIGRA